MKGFFKFMFASMLGTFLTIVILLFIMFMVIVSVVSFNLSKEVTVSDNSLLHVTLDKPIFDRSPKLPFFVDESSRMGLNDIIKNIRKAKNDPSIKGIYLDISYIPAGLATLEEIRDVLTDFKTSGKPVVCYSEYYAQSAYYLASVADKIYIQPEGAILFKGINAEMFFLKGALDKLGIKMQVIRHGKFKAATEPFFLDRMSPENRIQVTALIKNEWNKVLEDISVSRKISVSRLNEIADSLNAQDPQAALKNGLVDHIAYKDQFLSDVKKMMNLAEDQEISMVSLEKYSSVVTKQKTKALAADRIAIIYASGNIVDGNGNDQSVGSEKFAKAIRKARKDSKIKAIVLRVNSPGGSALASDVIWREVSLTAKEKPVVASFGDVAASGGYYISCPSTKIIAEPTTITGSIGVFGVIPDMKGFFNSKLGITFDNAKTNANSDYISITGPLSTYQSMKLQAEIEKIYSSFVSKVAEGRHLSKEKVDSIGQGRVWNAKDAKSIGLIDDFGGLDKAVEIAAELAKIKDYRIINLPEQKDPFEEFIDQVTGNESFSKVLEKELGEDYRYIRLLQELREMKGVQARMPFELILN